MVRATIWLFRISGRPFRPPVIQFFPALSPDSEKVPAGLLVLVAAEFGVPAANLCQPLKGAAVLLKKPCGFHCAAPAGGKGELLNAVLPHGGDEPRGFVVPDHLADVEVLVTAVPGNLVLPEKAAVPSSLSSSQTAW